MQLTAEQVKKFTDIHQEHGGLENYTDEQVREVAQGVFNYYQILIKIDKKLYEQPKESK